MKTSKPNVTFAVEEELLLAARKVAPERRTSVNQLVRDYLLQLIGESRRRRLALARLGKALDAGLVEVGERSSTRDDIYER